MLNDKRVREIIGQADPAMGLIVPTAAVSAPDLIARAEASLSANPPVRDRRMEGREAGTGPEASRAFRPSRRWVLASAASVVAAGGVAVAVSRARTVSNPNDQKGTAAPRPSSDPAGTSQTPLVVPIVYQVAANPPVADQPLRSLAGRLASAPYDTKTGKYAYHRIKSWGQPRVTSPEGFVMSRAQETRTWTASDGHTTTQSTELPAEFPTDASRRYWTQVLADGAAPASASAASLGSDPGSAPLIEVPGIAASSPAPLPSDPARLAELLAVRLGPGAVAKQVHDLYQAHVIPQAPRRRILEILAEVDGFRWRGAAADRAGRPGVAITADDSAADQRATLIFDESTGTLLGYETTTIKQPQVLTYTLFLEYDRTNVTS